MSLSSARSRYDLNEGPPSDMREMIRTRRIDDPPFIAVVVPCFRVSKHILGVIEGIGPEVRRIYVVDDKCPESSGDVVERKSSDLRVKVLRHETNKGVGGAVMTGYRAALAEGADIIVKIDGDGQMDPALLPSFVSPLIAGEADYAKGNRFYSIETTRQMPAMRLFGNAVLSFMTKLSSGYWGLFDPTNGYTAIHRKAALCIDFSSVSERYFFETDMLIKLGDVRAVVVDIPMVARYQDEVSNLKIKSIVADFLGRHIAATFRRIFYNYFVRDFNAASLNFLAGLILFLFGCVFGALSWRHSVITGIPTTTGTVMLAVLPIVAGLQMLLFFLGFDMSKEPNRPLQRISGMSTLLKVDPRSRRRLDQ